MGTDTRAIELKLILSSQGDLKLVEGEKSIRALVEISDKAALGFSRMNLQLQRLIEGFERFAQTTGTRAGGGGGENSIFGQAFGGSFLGTLTGNLLPSLIRQLNNARRAAVDFFEDSFKSVVRATEQYERFQISLEGVLRSQEAAQRVSRLAFQAGAQSPFGIGDLENASKQLIKVPQLRGQFFGPEQEVEDRLKKLFDLTTRLASIDPERGIPGAVQAIRFALQGQFRLLTRQYSISIGELVEASGKSAQELKANSNALLEALRTVTERLVTDDTLKRLQDQVSTRISNINEYLKTVIPRTVGGKGFYDTVKKLLGFVDEELLAFVSPGGSFDTKFAQRFSDSFSKIVVGAARSIAAILGTTLNISATKNPFEGIAEALAGFAERVAKIVDSIATFLESGSGKSLISAVAKLFLGIGRALVTAVDSLINLLGRIEHGIEVAKGFLPGGHDAVGEVIMTDSEGRKFSSAGSGFRGRSAIGGSTLGGALSQFETSIGGIFPGGNGGLGAFGGTRGDPTTEFINHVVAGFRNIAQPMAQAGELIREEFEKSLLTPLQAADKKFGELNLTAGIALQDIASLSKDTLDKFNLLIQTGLLGEDPQKIQAIADRLDAALKKATESVTDSENVQKLQQAIPLLNQLFSLDPKNTREWQELADGIQRLFEEIGKFSEGNIGAKLIRQLVPQAIGSGVGDLRTQVEGFTAFGGGDRSQLAQNREMLRLIKEQEGALGRNLGILRNINLSEADRQELEETIATLLGIQADQLEKQNNVIRFRKSLADAEDRFQRELAGVTTGGVAGQEQRQGIVSGRIHDVQLQMDLLNLEFEAGVISVADYNGKLNALEDILKGLTRQNDDFTRSISEQTRQMEIQHRLQDTFAGSIVQALNLNTTDPRTGEPRIRSFSEIASQEGNQFGVQFVQGVQKGLGDSLYNLFKGNFDSIGEAWQSFLDSMLRAFADMLSQMLVRGLFSQVFGGLFGGLTGGGGGFGGGGGLGGGAGGILSAVTGGVGSSSVPSVVPSSIPSFAPT